MAERQKGGPPPTKAIEPNPATFEEILQAVVTPADPAQLTDLSEVVEGKEIERKDSE